MEQLTLIGRAERIIESVPGDVVLVSDFSDLAAASQVSRLLAAFVREGRLFRFAFQVYVKGSPDDAGVWHPVSRDIPAIAARIVERLNLPGDGELLLEGNRMSLHRGKRCIFSRDYAIGSMCIPPRMPLARTKPQRVPRRESRWREAMREPLAIIAESPGNIVCHSVLSKRYGTRKAGQIFARLRDMGAVEAFSHGIYIKNVRQEGEWSWSRNPAEFFDLVVESLRVLGMKVENIWHEAGGYAIKCSGRKSSRSFERGDERARIFS